MCWLIWVLPGKAPDPVFSFDCGLAALSLRWRTLLPKISEVQSRNTVVAVLYTPESIIGKEILLTKLLSVRVFSVAKVYAFVCGILGLLFAPFVLLGPGLAMAGGERRGFGGAIFLAVIFPFLYGFIGFLMGGLFAFIYNAISHSIGGIEVELELPPPTILNVPRTPLPSPTLAPPGEFQPPATPEFE